MLRPLHNWSIAEQMTSSRFLFSNGVVLRSSDVPPITTFLESHPGAYTTTRTHNGASSLLFWERHVKRLAESIRILLESAPKLLFRPNNASLSLPLSLPVTSLMWESAVRALVDGSMKKVLPIVMNERNGGEELSVTVLVSGNSERLGRIGKVGEERLSEALDVHVYVWGYVPRAFSVRGNGARVAVAGRGRDVANAKYSDWVRLRKHLEKLRPPSVTELLLSNDGDQILEGCVTNFFAVCRKDKDEAEGNSSRDHGSACAFEVQTAPIRDSVLPGIIRQIVMEFPHLLTREVFEAFSYVHKSSAGKVCLSLGIPFREVAPSWSKHKIWEEAFITNSLRLLEHVETIQAPSSWESLNSKTWEEISWEEKRFEDGAGMITTIIQKGIMEKVILEGFPLGDAV
ncbi:hypothetical protein CJ030_MR3G014555 [Morella rubra]|uniref:Class IV aminotransferase n=1 Tax=Morella rubra TaxID=262757 RepID=A0A6A1VZ01_9ROSI|nr:hypothetical protein CJ030_MR3G014555 [Morella rubra]